MVDFSPTRSQFESNNSPYFTFYPKSQKPIKAVIRHLPFITPAEDISFGLVNLGFAALSVKQMSTTRRSPAEGITTVNIFLFPITLPRTAQSHEIFKLASLRHIATRVQKYKDQTGLTQCYNGQRFGHLRVIANNLTVVCGYWGGDMHKECPEKASTVPIPTYCNCNLVDGEEPHPSNCGGCRHAEEEMRKGKSQSAQDYNGKPRHPRTILRGGATQQHAQLLSVAQACPATVGEMSTSTKSTSSGS
jgi:hypothetical protein